VFKNEEMDVAYTSSLDFSSDFWGSNTLGGNNLKLRAVKADKQ